MTFLKDGFRFIVFSNYWISFAAAAYAYLTVVQFNLNVPTSFYWFVFSATLCSYCLQRYVQLPGRKEQHSERQDFLVGNRLYLGLTVVGAGIATLTLGYTFLTLEQMLWIIPIGLVSLFYSIKVFGKNGGIRDLPGVKIIMIAISWTFLCGFLPVWVSGFDKVNLTQLSLQLSEKTLFIFAITIPFDIRDLKYDDPSKKTIPQLLGVKKSVGLSILLLTVALACGMLGSRDILLTLGLIGSYIITLMVISQVKESRAELYYSGLIDGLIILQVLMVLGCLKLA